MISSVSSAPCRARRSLSTKVGLRRRERLFGARYIHLDGGQRLPNLIVQFPRERLPLLLLRRHQP
jgi:hypothetical protein